MNNNKKTNRKNKTNQVVKWPTSYFTIKQLGMQNTHMLTKSDITLRKRLSMALEDKQVVEIGTQPTGKGRPTLVFACAPVSPSTIQLARDAGVIVHDSFNSVNVAGVTTQKTSIVTSPQTQTVNITDTVKV